MGMLTKRVPALAAKVALVAGFGIIAIGYFVPPFDGYVTALHEFHFLGVVFALLVAAMLLIGKLKPSPAAWVHADAKAVDTTPWRHAKITGAILILLVFAIYAAFADFSVLSP
jgi:SSS family solute:Na+ symporter